MEKWVIRINGEDFLEGEDEDTIRAVFSTLEGDFSLWHATCYNAPDVWDYRQLEAESV